MVFVPTNEYLLPENTQMPAITQLLIIILPLTLSNVFAKEPDWTAYRTVLTYLKPGVKHGVSLMQVDYRAIKETGVLARAYQVISDFNPEQLTSPDEQMAFYINTYNILALKMVADHWPTDSIKDSGNFFRPVWDNKAGVINGQSVSLGYIEHKILRPMGDPRIHLAIVCASISCPDLSQEPYTAAQLNEQLNDQAKRFLDNPGKGLKLSNETIHVSKIFDWFEKDFGGKEGVRSFVWQYQESLPTFKIKADLPYDWATNGTIDH